MVIYLLTTGKCPGSVRPGQRKITNPVRETYWGHVVHRVADNVDRSEADTSSVLGRAALMLDAFTWDAPVLSLNDLTIATGLPKSTVHRFADRLIELGWLERTINGYQIGMRVFEVGGLAERRNRLHGASLPHLQALSAATNCAIHLAVLDRNDVLYLERLPASRLDPPTYAGGRKPPTCTALGKAMLAFASDADLDRVIDNGLPKLTPRTFTDARSLRANLDLIRETGFAIDNEEYQRGTLCVAAPIRSAGRAIGAVSATGRIDSFDAEQTAAAVRVAVNRIWSDLFGNSTRRSA